MQAFFTQYKNTLLIRIRLCRRVGIRLYHEGHEGLVMTF